MSCYSEVAQRRNLREIVRSNLSEGLLTLQG